MIEAVIVPYFFQEFHVVFPIVPKVEFEHIPLKPRFPGEPP